VRRFTAQMASRLGRQVETAQAIAAPVAEKVG